MKIEKLGPRIALVTLVSFSPVIIQEVQSRLPVIKNLTREASLVLGQEQMLELDFFVLNNFYVSLWRQEEGPTVPPHSLKPGERVQKGDYLYHTISITSKRELRENDPRVLILSFEVDSSGQVKFWSCPDFDPANCQTGFSAKRVMLVDISVLRPGVYFNFSPLTSLKILEGSGGLSAGFSFINPQTGNVIKEGSLTTQISPKLEVKAYLPLVQK